MDLVPLLPTGQHGQSPMDSRSLTEIADGPIIDQLNAA